MQLAASLVEDACNSLGQDVVGALSDATSPCAKPIILRAGFLTFGGDSPKPGGVPAQWSGTRAFMAQIDWSSAQEAIKMDHMYSRTAAYSHLKSACCPGNQCVACVCGPASNAGTPWIGWKLPKNTGAIACQAVSNPAVLNARHDDLIAHWPRQQVHASHPTAHPG